MREVKVSYFLLSDDELRLKKITEEYKKKGLDLSETKIFEAIMSDIDKKFKLHE